MAVAERFHDADIGAITAKQILLNSSKLRKPNRKVATEISSLGSRLPNQMPTQSNFPWGMLSI